jgi:hypothetical protein
VAAPFIASVNWRQGVQITVTEAASLLRQLQMKPSSPFHGRIVESNPQVVQVWFEPEPGAAPAPPAVTSLLVVLGSTKISPEELSWAAAAPATLGQALAPGGRVQIRVHCGHLFDVNSAVFSDAADVVTSVASGVLAPGGTLESWFFVRRG